MVEGEVMRWNLGLSNRGKIIAWVVFRRNPMILICLMPHASCIIHYHIYSWINLSSFFVHVVMVRIFVTLSWCLLYPIKKKNAFESKLIYRLHIRSLCLITLQNFFGMMVNIFIKVSDDNVAVCYQWLFFILTYFVQNLSFGHAILYDNCHLIDFIFVINSQVGKLTCYKAS